MDLADLVIKANEEEERRAEEEAKAEEEERIIKEIVHKRDDDGAPRGFYTDDLGYWVELDIRKDKLRFARYIYTRCRRLNPKLHARGMIRLYNGTALILDTPLSISKLARSADNISSAQATWVYRRLLETVPCLDESRIEIAPGLLWNCKTQDLEWQEEGTYITI